MEKIPSTSSESNVLKLGLLAEQQQQLADEMWVFWLNKFLEKISKKFSCKLTGANFFIIIIKFSRIHRPYANWQ